MEETEVLAREMTKCSALSFTVPASREEGSETRFRTITSHDADS